MSSILNAKERIVDSLITKEGRRQIANGKLRAEFYSFSDAGAFYSKQDTFASASTMSDSITTEIPFQIEASSLPQDEVTFEADDSGKLVTKELKEVNGKTLRLLEGIIYSGSTSSMVAVTTSAEFQSLSEQLLQSSIDNFQKLYILGSPSLFRTDRDEFIISNKEIKFAISDTNPIPVNSPTRAREANIDNIESLFADKRLSHLPNYKFLPPVNKARVGTNKKTPLGLYQNLSQNGILTFEDLKISLDDLETKGFMQEVKFVESSEKNRIFGQMFELGGNQIKKLDVIDFGTFEVKSKKVNGIQMYENKEVTDQQTEKYQRDGTVVLTKHVFFVGKLFLDSNGSHTFINLYTCVFS